MTIADADRQECHRRLSELTQKRVEFGAPPKAAEAVRISDRDLLVLHTLAEHRFLTTSQLALFCFGGLTTRFWRRLKELHDAHLIRRFRPMVSTRSGSVEWVYELDVAGAVELEGRAGGREWHVTELHDFAYVEHDLELNGLMLDICAEATRETGRPPLAQLPFTWQGDRTGLVNPSAEARPLDAHPSSQLSPDAIFIPGLSTEGIVDPDATLTGHHARTGEPFAVLLEYDRTRRASKLTTKLQRYDWFVTDGWRRTRFARMPGPPLILFVTRHEAQLASLITHAAEILTAHLSRSGEPIQYPGRERIGFTSAERISAANDHVMLVSAAPNTGDCRAVALQLGRVFAHG